MNVQLPGVNPIRLDGIQNDKTFTSKTLDLQFGQMLKAVVAINPQEGQLLLKLNGNLLQARSNQTFHAGEVLTLKVGGNPKEIILTVLDRDNRQAILQQAMRQSLPAQKPAQQFLNQLQQLAQGQASKTLSLPTAVHKASAQLLNNIASLSQIRQGPGLEQAVKDMGMFLEKKLLNNSQPQLQQLNQDHKALLLQLKQVVNKALEQHQQATKSEGQNNNSTHATKTDPTRQTALPLTSANKQNSATNKTTSTPNREATSAQNSNKTQYHGAQNQLGVMKSSVHKSLSLPLPGAKPQPIKHEHIATIKSDNPVQLLEGMKEQITQTLARIQSHQLSSLPQDSGVAQQFLFELPVKVGNKIDVLPFLIEEEEQNTATDDKNKKSWSVMLALDLDNLGEMQVKVALHDTQVSVNFWSTTAQTADLIARKQGQLKSELANEALELKSLHCHQGLVESNIDSKAITLLDIKA